MKLLLSKLSPNTRGIYNIKGVADRLPERFLFLHPDAAESFVGLENDSGGLVYSDILRSPSESLRAMAAKSGVKAPGYSGHNFGFSFDVAVEQTMKLRGLTYPELLALLQQHGWFCHRMDGASGFGKSEFWHFNFLGSSAGRFGWKQGKMNGWGSPIEQKIQETYGPAFKLSLEEAQQALKSLKLYTGDVDGSAGPLTRTAIELFQRTWKLKRSGALDTDTMRVLACVTAEIVTV